MFYGWWIIAAGSSIQLMQAALFGQAYGSYVVVLHDQFGWSKTMLSAASSLREAESGVMGPIQGWLLDRLGPRRVARVGVLIMGLGFMLFSRVNSPVTFFLAFFVISVGASLAGYLTVTFAAVHWFERRRATAISLTSTGFALGGMLVPVTVLMLESWGWRTTAFLSGIAIVAIGLPLTQVLRHHPHEHGLHPDGDTPELDGHSRPVILSTTHDFTLGEAVRTPAFWWVSLGHASALFIVSAMGVHLVSHLKQSQGYSLGQAQGMASLLTFLFLIGTLTGGIVGDRVSKRGLVIACMAMHATGLVILSHASGTPMVLAFILLHGLAWGWRGPQMSALRADYFGRAAFGQIMGLSSTVIILGTISGPLIAGIAYDQTGDYRLGFDILAAIAAAGSIFFVLARKPDPPRRSSPSELTSEVG